MQADGVISYEIIATNTYAKFTSKSVIAYDDYNEFIQPNVTFIQKDRHNITSNEAIYKDNNGDYIANGYFLIDDKLLNAEIKYIENETYTDYYGDYIEVYVEFVDKKNNALLNEIVNSVGDDKNE